MYRKVGDWTIGVDDTLGSNCFMGRDFADRTGLRYTLRSGKELQWLMIGNSGWQSLERGKTYRLRLELDNGKTRTVDAIGSSFPGVDFVALSMMVDLDFTADLVGARSLAISRNGQSVTTLSLGDSLQAVDALVECQDQAEAMRDPFRSDGPARKPPTKDPFAQ